MSQRPMRRGNWSVQELERLRHLLPRRGVAGTAVLLRRSEGSVRRRAEQLFARAERRTVWAADDELQLRRAWGALEVRLIALMLGRPSAEIGRRIAHLRERLRSGPWTRTEDRLLKELYGTRADADLQVALLRSATDIAEAARRLCLQKDKRFAKALRRVPSPAGARMPRWTPAQVEALVRFYADRDNLDVARQLGRTVASVANKAWQLGLKKSPQLLERIGRANIAGRYAAAATAN